MRTTNIVFRATLLAVMLGGCRLDAATTIVVNSGRQGSAEAAGRSEAQVNWSDGDPADDTICTECSIIFAR